jgi:tRNA pseudouridine synthase 10
VVHIFPIIITGRYTKLQRTIAQTRHFCFECKGSGKKHGNTCNVCKGEKVLTKESVQELIAPFFQKEFTCNEVVFHGAGREDVDVRMLGGGRPFALTLENPRVRNTDVEKLRVHINHALKSKVELFDLAIGHPTDVEKITRAYHTKRYRALVESPNKIDVPKLHPFIGKKIDVVQLTPVRVEKRRVMKERPHWIILESVKPVDAHHIEVELHASAGCYIKEFISGDNGRSNPSLKEWLGCACTCKELDVLEIVDVE